MRSLAALLLLATPQLMLGQAARASRQRSIVGTYRHFGAAHEGCAIEVGERRADSIRVQFDCNRGAPSYHHGANDVRIPLRDGIVYPL